MTALKPHGYIQELQDRDEIKYHSNLEHKLKYKMGKER